MSQATDIQQATIPPALTGRVLTGDHGEDSAPVLVPERFVIDDAQKASWAVRKILEARAYAARVRQWSERELRRAEHDEQWLLRRFGSELETWLRGELARSNGRRRSINLPGGMIGLRMQPARLDVVDEPLLLAWCRAHLPAALKVSVETQGDEAAALFDWQRQRTPQSRVHQHALRDPLARYLGETGEVPQGAVVRPLSEQFYVR
jgi:hypothetical protein